MMAEEFQAAWWRYGALVTPGMAAPMAEVSRNSVYEAMQHGRVEFVQIHGTRFVVVESLLKYRDSVQRRKQGKRASGGA